MNQRGFATLEIICVILIISVLTTIAVPQMVRLLDKARLDYEMKTFLNNLELARSLERGTNYSPEIFKDSPFLADKQSEEINLYINENSYEILKNGKRIGDLKELPNGFSLRRNDSLKNPLEFSHNNNGTLTILSKFDERRIIFDSVGRWRGDISEK